MTLRLTLIAATIGAATLPLITVTLPASVAVWPSPALAEETTPAAKTPYSELDRRAIRKRIRALRRAIRIGDLTPYERKQARAKIRAYRKELRAARRQAYTGEQQPRRRVKMPEAKSAPQPPAAKSGKAEAKHAPQLPAAREGNMPEAESNKQAVNISEADCKDVWNEANENGDDVLADDEAAPFLGAFSAASAAGTSEPTIRQIEFMDACRKGAFKDLM